MAEASGKRVGLSSGLLEQEFAVGSRLNLPVRPRLVKQAAPT